MLETGLRLVFLSCPKLAFFESSHLVETVKNVFVLVVFHFRFGYGANFSNFRQQNGVTWKDMIDIKSFLSMRLCDRQLLQFDCLQHS